MSTKTPSSLWRYVMIPLSILILFWTAPLIYQIPSMDFLPFLFKLKISIGIFSAGALFYLTVEYYHLLWSIPLKKQLYDIYIKDPRIIYREYNLWWLNHHNCNTIFLMKLSII